MALATAYSSIRRVLAQRMNYWGGNVSTNGPGQFTATGTSNTAIDITRAEQDDEWDNSWIVLNPGSIDQINAPTIWRRVTDTAGWVEATGTFTIHGTWPSPYNVVGPGFATGTSTAVGTFSLTDGAATWTVNQWKGHLVTIGGLDGVILSNTATVLTITSGGWGGTTPSNGTYVININYEVYKTFRPENWLQAINWAISNSYPMRHVQVNFEVPQDPGERIINWGNLVKNLQLSNPTVAPTVTEAINGQGFFVPGTYTFGYTLFNDLGETLLSPTTTLTIVGNNSEVAFSDLAVPAGCLGVNYYSSTQPGDTNVGLLSMGQAFNTSSTLPNGAVKGLNFNGTVYGITFLQPYTGQSSLQPTFNQTNVDVQELHHIIQRINPGAFPEIWNDLGSDLYKPMGGKTIMLMYTPLQGLSLRFFCTAVVPSIVNETDVTDEPPELLFAGGEYYLWQLLVRTSTIVNTNWNDLAKTAIGIFRDLSDDYALDRPRTNAFRPVIRTQS